MSSVSEGGGVKKLFLCLFSDSVCWCGIGFCGVDESEQCVDSEDSLWLKVVF